MFDIVRKVLDAIFNFFSQNSLDEATAHEFHILKDGLRIVDEIRDCMIRRIADIQEEKLYAQLNNTSSDNFGTNHEDIDITTREEKKSLGKTAVPLESSHIESLSAHFRGLKTILDEVKQAKKDR